MSKQLKVVKIEKITKAGPLRDRIWLSDGRIFESFYESGGLYRVDGERAVEANDALEELDAPLAEFRQGRPVAEFLQEGEGMAADAARKVSVTLDYEWGDDGDIRIIRVKDDE